MKEFIEENKVVVIVLGVIIILSLVLSVWGITSLVSKDDKKQNNNPNDVPNNEVSEKKKYDSINEAKDAIDSDGIEKLYNYVLGMGYVSSTENGTSYISEIYTDGVVKYEDLSEETILRAGITQTVICGGQYENKTLPYEVVKEKIKEIFGKTIENPKTYAKMTSTGGYSCLNGDCLPEGGAYCTKFPLDNGNKLYSVSKDFSNSNILYLYEETEEEIMYRHTFRKIEGNYYWYSTEMLGK